MYINIKETLQNLHYGNRNTIFLKLSECTQRLKERATDADLKVWQLAYNLRYLGQSQRYVEYIENPKRTQLDQGLLPFVKFIHAYARMNPQQQDEFQRRIEVPSKASKKVLSSTKNQNSYQYS